MAPIIIKRGLSRPRFTIESRAARTIASALSDLCFNGDHSGCVEPSCSCYHHARKRTDFPLAA